MISNNVLYVVKPENCTHIITLEQAIKLYGKKKYDVKVNVTGNYEAYNNDDKLEFTGTICEVQAYIWLKTNGHLK
jgi:hypothetical protein